ncbi:MAG: GNAT family N-acetyltransferase [Oscillospiraceae bacterium]|nr:GNAT family N-acetyltransferase [Oscillospiraceae bacterium]
MIIKFKNIILRDMTKADIGDDIRWNTVETDWAHWDAPWESEPDLLTFDPEEYRKKELLKLGEPKDEIRWGFEIDTAEGKHIGAVNSYMINEEYDWTPINKARPGEKLFRTVGIDICESSFCGKGLGTEALAAFIKYYLDNGEEEIYTQTWSGNIRMIKCAEKLGFEVCRRKEGIREVRGEIYGGLTFRLDKEKFGKFLEGNKCC